MKPDLNPELKELIDQIAQKNMYSGNKIPDSIMRMFEIVEDDSHIGILVPYWLSVLQEGRGPRKTTTDHGLVKIIYAWMQKRNLFKSGTEKGKLNEAKSMTWYINKYGNKQFRTKVFIDIYKSLREETVKKVMDKFGFFVTQVTHENGII